jgi:hypothetical protein
MTTLPIPIAESIDLRVRPHEDCERAYSARFWPVSAANVTATRGIVEIHIGDDVYVDEWADSVEQAQKWVDGFEFEEWESEWKAAAEEDGR